MSCPEFDWKAYSLEELSGAERKTHERHLGGCEACRTELEQLKITTVLLKRLPEAEPPRRIAFVSDPVFEPSWWRRFWNSGPKLGFASAAVLAAAILVHGAMVKPQPQVIAPAAVAAIDVKAEVAREVAKAVGDVRAEHREMVLKLASELERKTDEKRRTDMKDVKSAFNMLERQMGVMYVDASRRGGD